MAEKMLEGYKIGGLVRLCVILSAVLSAACSIPNLEPAACAGARPFVREFYSFHFGNEMAFSSENLKLRERFLSPDLFRKVVNSPWGLDPFTTGTDNFPRAFRVGGCTELARDRPEFQVLLFWRDETSTEQKTISVEAVKSDDKWLIDRIDF